MEEQPSATLVCFSYATGFVVLAVLVAFVKFVWGIV